ncbi:MAG: hypothetical protein V7727_21910, partial [Sneathiella sp.]
MKPTMSDGEKLNHFFETQNLQFDKCLEPLMTCKSKSIKAHSIQNAGTLGLLERNGHVVMPKQHHSKDGPSIKFKEVGRNLATTFTGFCAKHDQTIFKPLDTKPFSAKDSEQLFLLAYRSICRELHVIMEAAVKMQSSYNWRVDKKLEDGNTPTPAGIVATTHMMKSWETWKYRNKNYDEPLLKNRFGTIKHSILVLENQNPTIAVSALFSFASSQYKRQLLRCVLNVFPTSPIQTIVIFSYTSQDAKKVRKEL